MEMLRIDTLGRIRAGRYGLFGWCLDCSAEYWKHTPPCNAPPSSFDIDLDKLIAARGEDQVWTAKMRPVPCPRCGSQRVEIRLSAPDRRTA